MGLRSYYLILSSGWNQLAATESLATAPSSQGNEDSAELEEVDFSITVIDKRSAQCDRLHLDGALVLQHPRTDTFRGELVVYLP